MTGIFEKAVQFAFNAHRGQKRKDGSAFILHPLEVAVIVGTMTRDEEVLAAAVLHDTVEDTFVTAEEILAQFGERVAEFVRHETENKRREIDPRDTWRIRKEESLAVLKESNRETKMLWVADKLSNLRSLARSYEAVGASAFSCFNERDPKQQRWYFATVLEYCKELSDYPAYAELESCFRKVFAAYE